MTTSQPGPETIFSPMFQDFDDALRDNENRWFDGEHVPQRLLTPGFLRAERYETSPWSSFAPPIPGPRYVNFYFITEPSVVESDAYERQGEFKSFRVRNSTRARNGLNYREVWSEETALRVQRRRYLLSAGPKTLLIRGMARSATEAPDVAPESELRLSCPGVIGFQRFRRNDDVVFARPREHRAPEVLDFYWLTAPEVATGPAFLDVSRILAARSGGSASGIAWEGLYLQRPSPWELVADYD